MSKALYVVVAIILMGILTPSTAYAFDPLDPTDNATAQYIFTDNFTVTLEGLLQGEYTITGLESAITTAGVASVQVLADSLQDRLADIFAFALPIFLTVIAVWRRTWLLYVPAGFAWVLYGFGYWPTSHYMSIILVLVGIFCFAGAKWDRS